MKEFSVAFNDVVARAARLGQKTQDRRPVDLTKYPHYPDNLSSLFAIFERYPEQKGCPYGRVGDRVWGKEAFCKVPARRPVIEPSRYDGKLYFYKADNDRPTWVNCKWKPPILMPRSASRLSYEIVAVRVQRLQSVSPEEAIAEGLLGRCPGIDYSSRELLGAFIEYWDSRFGKEYPSESNPWMWVRDLKQIKVED